MNMLLIITTATTVTVVVNIIFIKGLTKELKIFEERIDTKIKMLRK